MSKTLRQKVFMWTDPHTSATLIQDFKLARKA